MTSNRTIRTALLAGGLFLSAGTAIHSDLLSGRVDAAPKKAKPITAAQRMKLLKTFVKEFVEIAPGTGKFPRTFKMGSANGPKSERPVRTVTMTVNFSIAKYEVPQDLYQAVIGKNPSVWGGPRNSCEMMTWTEADIFCRRVTEKLRDAKLIRQDEIIRLPSEAEWEYCCRAGTTTAYSFGESATKPGDRKNIATALNAYGWHTGNAKGNDPPIGALKPNAWGLYDMHGYLWEFVADEWHADFQKAPKTSVAWVGTKRRFVQRVMRGGSWRDRYEQLRSTTRMAIVDHARSDAVGFRCVKSRVKTSR
ncbi:MAG: formylglycine-generating enzyme family protein [Planctomycetes bacterium]|nr:formylglycine-generating enzyme family protein [Planctomycetota bacterium]